MKKIVSIISILFLTGCNLKNPLTVELPQDKLAQAAENIALALEDNRGQALLILDECSEILENHKVTTEQVLDLVEPVLEEKQIPIDPKYMSKIKKFITINIKAFGINVDPEYETGWGNLKNLVNGIRNNLREP